MAMIWPCVLSVEAYAAAGKEVVVPRPWCSSCEGRMVFWSGYGRFVRRGAVFRIWVKRARCEGCGVSHGLLPSFCLLGRLDAVEVIGEAVAAVAGGAGVAKLAGAVDVPHTTVRGWWRRHRENSAVLLLASSAAAGLGVAMAELSGVAEVDAVAGLKTVAAVAARIGIGEWSAMSLLSAGRWLSTNMDPPFAAWSGWGLMVTMAQVARRPP